MEYFKFKCKPGDKISFSNENDEETGDDIISIGVVHQIVIEIDGFTTWVILDNTGTIISVDEHESISVIESLK